MKLPEKIEIFENETLKIDFTSIVSDPDDDEVEILVKDLPREATFINNTLVWTPSFDFVQGAEFKNATISFVVSDGKNLTESEFLVKVNDKNRAPKIKSALQSAKTVFVGDSVYFEVNAIDPDGDELSYKWKFGLFEFAKGSNKLRRVFTSSGNKLIKAIVCDKEACSEQLFSVSVVG